MRLLINIQNPRTGEIRHVKCGFSWTLFIWSAFFGLPLFLRKLNVWGFVVLLLVLVALITGPFGLDIGGLQTIFTLVLFAFYFWLGIKGNEITAKNYLDLGWQLAEPDSELTRMAMRHWDINLPESVVTAEVPAAKNGAIT